MAAWSLISYAPNAKCVLSVSRETLYNGGHSSDEAVGSASFDTWADRFQAYRTKANTSNLPDYDNLVMENGSWTYKYTFKVDSTQSGYDFVGWYSLPNDVDMASWVSGTSLPDMATVLVESGDEVASDQILARCKAWTFVNSDRHFLLVPKFVPQHGVLAFDANGGDVSPDYKTVAVGSAYGALPTPTRTGYAFAGWFTAASGGSSVSASTVMGASAAAVIHAHWSASGQTRTIYLDPAGGSCATASQPAVVGSAVGTLPTPTRTGYAFAGWFRSTVGSDEVTAATVMGESDMTLYAHWSAAAVTITFNANGGTVSEASRNVPYGRQLNRLPIAVSPGQAFDGWFTAATGGTEVTKTTIATESREVFAHWCSNSASLWSVTTF